MKSVFVTVLLGIAGASVSSAQPLTAVRPLDGYACMRLNLPREQMVSRTLNAPIFAEPSSSSRQISQASAVVITRSPMNIRNGFAEVLTLDGKPGWFPERLLGPYATASNPGAHCAPVLMSDGRPGFG